MTQDKSGVSSDTLAPIIQHRASISYSPVRNRLAEQDKSPMNQTFTIGQGHRGRQRSNSIDSDVVDYTIQEGSDSL
ncbi:hypothetical protein L596_012776 [Steinernema carpocapsae]|uniref:Uncharacterized protein n=1 Tax=Steinernema carpocapsae TaxID=34508 RepID=A0A4U5NYW8_STECR|nr:hypothetical protein L596_012776 [Steinernema carpocapsae]